MNPPWPDSAIFSTIPLADSNFSSDTSEGMLASLGELGGLSRVRGLTQDDSHVFAREDQVAEIFAELIEGAKELYATVQMDLKLRLSFRDDTDGYWVN